MNKKLYIKNEYFVKNGEKLKSLCYILMWGERNLLSEVVSETTYLNRRFIYKFRYCLQSCCLIKQIAQPVVTCLLSVSFQLV